MYNSQFIEEMVKIENELPISVRCYEDLFGDVMLKGLFNMQL